MAAAKDSTSIYNSYISYNIYYIQTIRETIWASKKQYETGRVTNISAMIIG